MMHFFPCASLLLLIHVFFLDPSTAQELQEEKDRLETELQQARDAAGEAGESSARVAELEAAVCGKHVFQLDMFSFFSFSWMKPSVRRLLKRTRRRSINKRLIVCVPNWTVPFRNWTTSR